MIKFNLIEMIKKVFNRKKTIKLGIYGAVNVGKTTLANRICMDWIGRTVGVVSEIPHETREVLKVENIDVKSNNKNLKMTVIDMPGIATTVDYKTFIKYGMNETEARRRAREATEGVIEAIKWLDNVDAVLLVMDSTQDPFTQVNITIIGNLEARKIPFIIVANKIDLPEADPDKIRDAFPQHIVIPISAKTGKNMDKLYDAIVRYLG